MPAIKKLGSLWGGSLLALYAGGAALGSQFFVDESGPTIAALAAAVVMFATACLVGAMTFGYNYFVAPSNIWRRDQKVIRKLQEDLRPAIKLEFDQQECVRDLPEGSKSVMQGGNRWHDTHHNKRHYLVKCRNLSAVTVDQLRVYITSVKRKAERNPAQWEDLMFEPVRLTPVSSPMPDGTIDVPPLLPRFFSVVSVVHPDSPYLSCADMPFAYEFLFKEQGVYEIGLKASAQDVLGDSLTIELCVKTSQAREINSGRPCTLYEVAWVRERTMLNGEGNANPS